MRLIFTEDEDGTVKALFVEEAETGHEGGLVAWAFGEEPQRGRPRIYPSNAERQHAYRLRKLSSRHN